MPTTSVDLTGDSAFPGTLPYMAPEQLEGKDADPRSDIFAFGAVMYEVVTRRRAFAGTSQATIIAQILQEDPPPMTLPAGLAPPAVDRIVRTCLAKDPAKRWQDASDLERELRWVVEDERQTRTHSGLALRRPWEVAAPPRRRARHGCRAAGGGVRSGGGLPCRPRPGWSSCCLSSHRRYRVEQKYCDGLAATLTAKLARLTASHQVQVVPASEIRTRRLESPEAARREVYATLAFEGSFLREGKSLQVNYALVDTATRSQLDAVSFTAPGDDPFAIQDRVVTWALAALELKVSDPERRALTERDTQVAGVYEYLPASARLSDGFSPSRQHRQRHRAVPASADARPASRTVSGGARRGVPGQGTSPRANPSGWSRRVSRAEKPRHWMPPSRRRTSVWEPLTSAPASDEKAVADFERALRTEPTSDEAYPRLARAQDRLGLRRRRSRRIARRSIFDRPTGPAATGSARSIVPTRATTRRFNSTSKPCSSRRTMRSPLPTSVACTRWWAVTPSRSPPPNDRWRSCRRRSVTSMRR